MILTGTEIISAVDSGEIIIELYCESKINPNSYDLTLHRFLYTYEDEILDPKIKYPELRQHRISEEGFLLLPGKLYLGRTNEYTPTDTYVPMLEGKSSIGRLGIDIHKTAGVGDIGFRGNWTLELAVTQPVYVYPDMPICQIIYYVPKGGTTIQYNGKYQDSLNVLASKIYEEM